MRNIMTIHQTNGAHGAPYELRLCLQKETMNRVTLY